MLRPGRPTEGPRAPAASEAQAIETVTRGLASDGIVVLSAEDAERRVTGESFGACRDLDCGARIARQLGVDFVVLVTVWAPRGTPTTVVVTFVGATDSAAGDAPVARGEVAQAASAALATARQRWEASRMGALVVRSSPEGADVEVDGRLVGRTPSRNLVMSGRRQVRVHLDGHEPHEEAVLVEAAGEAAVDVALRAFQAAPSLLGAGPTSRAGAADAAQPDWVANGLLGGGLVAAGVAALVSPSITLAGEGQCADDAGLPPGWCRAVVRFGVASGVLLGTGLAAVASGVVVLAAQPFRVQPVVSAERAMLEVGGTF
jgi:hypothetical protein